MSEHRDELERGHECAARRATRCRTVASAVLLAASTMAFAASSGSSVPASGGWAHALLSVSGTTGRVGGQSLMTRAAARVSSMLADSNPSMALESVGSTPGGSAVRQPPPPVLAASLAGERAKLLESMLAKEDAAAEIPLKAAAALRAPAARVQQQVAHAGAALNAEKSMENIAKEAVQPARLQELQGTSRPAQLEQTFGQNAQTQASGAMVQVPESVVQQMEQQIAQLSAKVETLEHKQAADSTPDKDEDEMGNVRDRAAHAPSSVAFTSPAQAKAAALARLSGKSSAPVAERAAAAVNALINAHAARGGASKRAAAMIDRLISARLVQNGDAPAAPAARGTERPAAGARSSAGGFSIKGAYGPAAHGTRAPDKITKMLHAFSNRVNSREAAVVAVAQAQYPARQPSQYPQAPPVQFPSLPTEAPVSTASNSNLAAMESLPTPSKDIIYYPGEQTHLRAQAAMTPEALAQPNLPPSVVQQTGTGLYVRNPYSPVPMARPPLPDPMPTGYGATSTTGVQDHLFDIYSSKKNAEEYLGGAGGGAGAGGAIMAPTGVAMASASGGSSGDDKGSDPFDDAMFNVIHDCSLGGPGC